MVECEACDRWQRGTFLNGRGLPSIFQAHPRGSCRLVPHLDKHVVLFPGQIHLGVGWGVDRFSPAESADTSQLLQKLPRHTPTLPQAQASA